MIVVFIAVVNVCSRGQRREKESFFIELYDFFLRIEVHLEGYSVL